MGVAQSAQEPQRSMSVRDNNSKNDGTESQSSTPSLIPPSYSLKPVSTKHNVRVFAGIIFGNCLVSGCICLTLWGFARHANLIIWEKRAFNTLSLLFSGALGFGIGFLCDRIGLLARGKFLESAANSIEDIGSIVQGGFSQYAVVFAHRVRRAFTSHKPRANTDGAILWGLISFLVLSVFGRFGVVLLGFGFNLEENATLIESLGRPDWLNLTIANCMDPMNSLGIDINGELRSLIPQNDSQALDSCSSFVESNRAPYQLVRFPPQNRPQGTMRYNGNEFDEVTKLERFNSTSGHSIDLNIVSRGQRPNIQGTYPFQDFRGMMPKPSEWKAALAVQCARHKFVITPEAQNGTEEWIHSELKTYVDADSGKNISIADLGMTDTWHSRLRWVAPHYKVEQTTGNSSVVEALTYNTGVEIKQVPRNDPAEIWLLAITAKSLGKLLVDSAIVDQENSTSSEEIFKEDFMTNTPLVFRCSLLFEDYATGGAPTNTSLPELNFTDPYPPIPGSTVKRIVGSALHDYLRDGPSRGPEASNERVGYVRDFDYWSDEPFHYGIGRRNATDSELWLAAYIVQNMGIKLGYLNEDLLRRIEIQAGSNPVLTVLVIKWLRVAGILGGLLLLQILFVIMAIMYCRHSIELLDEVAMYSFLFGDFPIPGFNGQKPASPAVNQDGNNCQGYFQQENGGYRWVSRCRVVSNQSWSSDD